MGNLEGKDVIVGRVVLDERGRIQIPASVRKTANLKANSKAKLRLIQKKGGWLIVLEKV
tara:strand:- start:547 stop:723 length:177 start_codon:yes stop_codon:yes gene_type:complete